MSGVVDGDARCSRCGLALLKPGEVFLVAHVCAHGIRTALVCPATALPSPIDGIGEFGSGWELNIAIGDRLPIRECVEPENIFWLNDLESENKDWSSDKVLRTFVAELFSSWSLDALSLESLPPRFKDRPQSSVSSGYLPSAFLLLPT